MHFTDTHTHLYLDAFNDDRNEVVQRAVDSSVTRMLLPNIDSHSVEGMLELCDTFPEHCFPMIGLHPTSVKDNYEEELEKVMEWTAKRKFIAVGEIGIDLYWDKTHRKEQERAFRFQTELAISLGLPVVIHSRDSFDEITDILEDYKNKGLQGVFHCFTGGIKQAEKAIAMGFLLGIGGVITFKNSGLDRVVERIDTKHLLLETDSPFLAPVPFRGKRNESTYINIIAKTISDIKKTSKAEIAKITNENAVRLFNL